MSYADGSGVGAFLPPWTEGPTGSSVGDDGTAFGIGNSRIPDSFRNRTNPDNNKEFQLACNTPGRKNVPAVTPAELPNLCPTTPYCRNGTSHVVQRSSWELSAENTLWTTIKNKHHASLKR